MVIFVKIFRFFHFFSFFVFTTAGRAVYTRDLVKTVNMGNPYNFLADSAFAVVRGVVFGRFSGVRW